MLVTHEYCNECQQDTAHYSTSPGCSVCNGKKIKRKRENHFNNLDKFTLEQRVRFIEEWLYDSDLAQDCFSVDNKKG